jgi:hypothetical protein
MKLPSHGSLNKPLTRKHNVHPSHVTLRSPPLLLADDEGSPQSVGNIPWVAVRRNYRDSSSRQVGTQIDTGLVLHAQTSGILLRNFVHSALGPNRLQSAN